MAVKYKDSHKIRQEKHTYELQGLQKGINKRALGFNPFADLVTWITIANKCKIPRAKSLERLTIAYKGVPNCKTF